MSSEYTWKAYQYVPSIGAAYVATVLFAIATVILIVQLMMAISSRNVTTRSRRQAMTMIPFILGGLAELIGYIGRIISSRDTESLSPYIMQSVLLLVAPALFAATIYMTLARVLQNINCASKSIIPLKWLTKIFVFGDVFSFLLQGSGGGLMASNLYDTGKKLIIVGLFVQVAFFGLFIVVMSVFQHRVSNSPTTQSIAFRESPSRLRNWQLVILTLFVSSFLIFIRSIVRVVEYLQGNDGYIISHEVFLYTLDGLLMLFAMIVFIIEDVPKYFVECSITTLDVESTEMMDSRILRTRHEKYDNAYFRDGSR